MDNRRNFIKQVAAAGIVGSITPIVGCQTSEQKSKKDIAGFSKPESQLFEGEVSLVKDGEACAVVVVADDATKTARYASEELVRFVEKATGVRLKITPESAAPEDIHTRIYIGKTKSCANQGIDLERLPRETFIMRSVGNDLFIGGYEDDGDPLNQNNPNAGTLFGVYEFLENVLNVRWLWPGELGTYVPKTETVTISAVNKLQSPGLQYRGFYWGPIQSILRGRKMEEEDIQFGFSPDVSLKYAKELEAFLRRHRMGGQDVKPPSGHAFSGWWKKYGREHPEWFALRRDGVRGDPDPEAEHVDICVTNEELQDFIVKQWDGKSCLLLGPVDRPGRCICDKCLSWDAPQPENPPFFARYVYGADPRAKDVFGGVTSDRYARFWKVIQEKARKRNPDVLVSGSFIYENGFPAPVKDIHLNKNIYAEFVQWQDPYLRYFPMPDEAYEWISEQYMGWKKTGMRISYRPNYLHDGYVMPHFETKQSGDFFKFVYKNGTEGAVFDSLTGQWAVHGPRLYMHMRLLSNPELQLDDIRNEYYAAFGSAADDVKQYFEFWEDYAFKNVLHFVDLFKDPRRYRSYPQKVHKAFPLEVLDKGAKILDRAMQTARRDSLTEFAERVAFLQTGLEHARLIVNLAAVFDGSHDVPKERLEEGQKALKDLIRFRKENQSSYFSDLLWVTNYWERPEWNLSALAKNI